MLYRNNLINIFVSFFLLLLFLYSYGSENYNIKLFITLSLIPVIMTAINLYRNKNGLIFVYLIYLFLSCLSIPLLEVFIEEPFKNTLLNTSWYFLPQSEKSILIAIIFVIIYSLCANLLTIVKNKENKTSLDFSPNLSKKYYVFGSFLVLSFFFYLVIQFALGNLPLFSTYQEYFAASGQVPYYATFLFLYAIGIVSILVTVTKANYKHSILLIMLPGLLLLLTGNRGELLYPLMAGVGILIVRGIRLNKKIIISLLVVFFLIIPLIGEVRNIASFDDVKEVGVSITDPFITIGYTLRPLIFTVGWIEDGEDFVHGESFIVPFQRGVANNLPGVEPVEYAGKSYNYRERLPTMGYSIIAESYHNFGLFGLFLLPPLIICVFLFGERSLSINRLIISGGIAAIMINNVRNAFSFVPGQIVMLLLSVLLFSICWELIEKRKKVRIIIVKGHNK